MAVLAPLLFLSSVIEQQQWQCGDTELQEEVNNLVSRSVKLDREDNSASQATAETVIPSLQTLRKQKNQEVN